MMVARAVTTAREEVSAKDRKYTYTCNLGNYVSMTRLHSLFSLRSMSASGSKCSVIFGGLVDAQTDYPIELAEESWSWVRGRWPGLAFQRRSRPGCRLGRRRAEVCRLCHLDRWRAGPSE